MINYCFKIFISLLITTSCFAQSFQISEIDTTDFPLLKLSFTATGVNSAPVKDVKMGDINITDFNREASSSTVTGFDYNANPSLSLVFVVEQSSLMKRTLPGGENLWDVVREEAKTFINNFPEAGETEIALVGINSLANLQQDFTKDKNAIIDALNKIQLIGSLIFDPAFTDKNTGAYGLLTKRDYRNRRIMVFLSCDDPSVKINGANISDIFSKSDIEAYTIDFMKNNDTDLMEISLMSGAKYYNPLSRNDLKSVFSDIIADIKKKNIFELRWLSSYGCDNASLNRKLTVQYVPDKITVNTDYTAPGSSIAKLETSPASLYFGNPAPNDTSSVGLTLTARVTSCLINSIGILPDTYFKIVDWGGTPPPFIIDKDSSRTIRIKFRQGSVADYRKAFLIPDAEPCAGMVSMTAGTEDVKLIKPNGGELYSACSPFDIEWKTLDPKRSVRLLYSTNDGSGWNLIVNDTNGGKYTWTPGRRSKLFKIAVQLNPNPQYYWLKSFGGTGADGGSSIAFQKDGVAFYVVGRFEGKITFGNTTLTSLGREDMYIAKFDIDGNVLWAESAGGPLVDSAAGVAVDDEGNAYVTGVCYKGAVFGTLTPSMYSEETPYCFLARYSPDGGQPKVKLFGAVYPQTKFEADGKYIRVNNGDITIRGYYKREFKIDKFTLPETMSKSIFTLTYNRDFDLINLERNGQMYSDYSGNVTRDNDNNSYYTGTFNNTYTRGTLNVHSRGQSDIYIYKYGVKPINQDESDAVFQVDGPDLSFSFDTARAGATKIGEEFPVFLESSLCNTGTFPTVIRSLYLSGKDTVFFELDTTLIGDTLGPGECVNLEMKYFPEYIGEDTVLVNVTGDCTSPDRLVVIAGGICGGIVNSGIDFGKEYIGKEKDTVISCIIKNANSSAVWIHPVLEGIHKSDFRIDPPGMARLKSGECYELKVSFMPGGEGLRNAVLNYQMPDSCLSENTNLVGEGEKLIGVDENISYPFSVKDPEPNPASEKVLIRFAGRCGSGVFVSMIDTKGRIVREKTIYPRGDGLHEFSLNAGDVPAGLYFIRIQSGSATVIKKLLVCR